MTAPEKIDVAVIIGSPSDREFVTPCLNTLEKLGLSFELRILSAHRHPAELEGYIKEAEERGAMVFIAAAGGAAHLPGVVASKTFKPVIGIPVPTSFVSGLDSLLSIVQMPSGVPVATVAVGKAGPVNAAVLAGRIIGLSDKNVLERVRDHLRELASRRG